MFQVCSQHRVNAARGIFLQAGHDVTVDVEGDGDARMADPFAGDLRMHPFDQEMTDVGVALEVCVTPMQAEDLAAPHARRHGQQHGDVDG